MISTSRMCGTSVSVVRPSASSAAAITLSTLFFAPVTRTSPASRAPPTTRNLSMRGIVESRAWSTSPASTPAPATTALPATAGVGASARTTPASRPTPTATRPARSSVSRWRPTPWRPTSRTCSPGCRTTSSTSVRTCARPIETDPKYPPLRVTQDQVDTLEREIDRFNADLEPLRSFVLAGGTPAAAHLHVARTVVRRAERATWRAAGGPSGHSEPADREVPEPALGPAVRPGPARQPTRSATWCWVPGANR